MRRKPWVMSDADTFDLLNAIDERLTTRALDQRHHDVLVRLRAALEEELAAVEATGAMRAPDEAACAEMHTA